MSRRRPFFPRPAAAPLAWLGVAALALGLVAGCRREAAPPPAPAGVTLRIAATPTIYEAVRDHAIGFSNRIPTIRTEVVVGTADALVQRLRTGLDVDIVLLDDPARMALLLADGVVAKDGVRTLAGNSLLLVVPPTSEVFVRTEDELADGRFQAIAIPDPETTGLGRVASEILETRGLWDGIAPALVPVDHERAALELALRGEIDAALVYGSDALVAGDDVRIAWTFPIEEPIHQAALAASTRHPASAEAFLASLAGSDFANSLHHRGFVTP